MVGVLGLNDKCWNFDIFMYKEEVGGKDLRIPMSSTSPHILPQCSADCAIRRCKLRIWSVSAVKMLVTIDHYLTMLLVTSSSYYSHEGGRCWRSFAHQRGLHYS